MKISWCLPRVCLALCGFWCIYTPIASEPSIIMAALMRKWLDAPKSKIAHNISLLALGVTFRRIVAVTYPTVDLFLATTGCDGVHWMKVRINIFFTLVILCLYLSRVEPNTMSPWLLLAVLLLMLHVGAKLLLLPLILLLMLHVDAKLLLLLLLRATAKLFLLLPLMLLWISLTSGGTYSSVLAWWNDFILGFCRSAHCI